jgi:hypothetical protein
MTADPACLIAPPPADEIVPFTVPLPRAASPASRPPDWLRPDRAARRGRRRCGLRSHCARINLDGVGGECRRRLMRRQAGLGARVGTLRIRQAAEPGGRHRVDIDFEDADAAGRLVRRSASTRFEFAIAPADRERLRWYFEDYLEYPADPAPKVAAEVEVMLTGLGAALFRAVFHSGEDARDLWARVRDRLPSLRVEVESDVDGAAVLPWELLRDPVTQSPLACAAAAFVRTHPAAARGPVLPPPPTAGGRLRVLLVICRPAGGEDVPFRSVAGQLVRHSDHPRSAVDLDLLRPPTFAGWSRCCGLRPGPRRPTR